MNEFTAMPGRLIASCGSFTLHGPRALAALTTALSVGLALTMALWLHLDAPYWAGISSYVCMQASHPASLRRAAHRVLGTFCGAGAALVLFPFVAFDHAATMLLLFLAGT